VTLFCVYTGRNDWPLNDAHILVGTSSMPKDHQEGDLAADGAKIEAEDERKHKKRRKGEHFDPN